MSTIITTVAMKRDSVQTAWKFATRDTEKCPLSVLTGVHIKRVNFRENMSFLLGQTKLSVISGCP